MSGSNELWYFDLYSFIVKSELTSSTGESWKEFMGECTKETAFEMLDFFYESGGNFIDTANNYQKEESEEWVGEWLEKRGVRDEMVIATKVKTFVSFVSHIAH